jgi:hypothetical protein
MRIAIASLIFILSSSAALGAGEGPIKPQPLEGQGYITMNAKGGAIEFLRDGKPYYIKGVGGQTRIDLAAESGANSTRTWDSGNAKQVLDQAQKLGMTATIGVWLEHNNASYKNEGYKAGIRKKVEALVNTAKNHPAMLIYALGNETNSGADTPEAWTFINELAEMIHKLDPNHPTMTVLAGSSTKTINNVAKYAPAIDVLGLNTYAGIVTAPRDAESSAFKGPYVITEWGPRGHWECAKTAWGAPLEQTSEEKQKSYASSYELITSRKARCLGSYVFLWGQKQERTPTWYGMFIENGKGEYKGEALPTVDVMTLAWSGKTPANLAPAINDVRINGKGNIRMFTTTEGSTLSVDVSASDANNDTLSTKFEVMAEATQLGNGGSFEGRPKSLADAVKKNENGGATLTAPAKGNYRLFVYVFDGKGKVSAMNIPFQVK